MTKPAFYKKWYLDESDTVKLSKNSMNLDFGLVEELSDNVFRGFFSDYEGTIKVNFPYMRTVGKYSLERSFDNSGIKKFKCPRLVTVDDYGMFCCFENTESLSSVNFKRLEKINQYGMMNVFANSNLSTLSIKKLQSVDRYGLYFGFWRTTLLSQYLDLNELETVGKHGMQYCFSRSGITSVGLNSLKTVDDFGMNHAFSMCPIKGSVSFPELTYVGEDGLKNVFGGCTGIEYVYFPKLNYEQYGKKITATYLGCGYAKIYWVDRNGKIVTVEPDNINDSFSVPVTGTIQNQSDSPIRIFRGPVLISSIPAKSSISIALLPSDEFQSQGVVVDGNVVTADQYLSTGVSFNDQNEVTSYQKDYVIIFKNKQETYTKSEYYPFRLSTLSESLDITPTTFKFSLFEWNVWGSNVVAGTASEGKPNDVSDTDTQSDDDVPVGVYTETDYDVTLKPRYETSLLADDWETFYSTDTSTGSMYENCDYATEKDSEDSSGSGDGIDDDNSDVSETYPDVNVDIESDTDSEIIHMPIVVNPSNSNRILHYCEIEVTGAETVTIGTDTIRLIDSKIRVTKTAFNDGIFQTPFRFITSITDYPMNVTVPSYSSMKSGVVVSLLRNGKSVYGRVGQELYELPPVQLNDQFQIYSNGLLIRQNNIQCSVDDSLANGYVQLKVLRFNTMHPSIDLY